MSTIALQKQPDQKDYAIWIALQKELPSAWNTVTTSEKILELFECFCKPSTTFCVLHGKLIAWIRQQSQYTDEARINNLFCRILPPKIIQFLRAPETIDLSKSPKNECTDLFRAAYFNNDLSFIRKRKHYLDYQLCCNLVVCAPIGTRENYTSLIQMLHEINPEWINTSVNGSGLPIHFALTSTFRLGIDSSFMTQTFLKLHLQTLFSRHHHLNILFWDGMNLSLFETLLTGYKSFLCHHLYGPNIASVTLPQLIRMFQLIFFHLKILKTSTLGHVRQDALNFIYPRTFIKQILKRVDHVSRKEMPPEDYLQSRMSLLLVQGLQLLKIWEQIASKGFTYGYEEKSLIPRIEASVQRIRTIAPITHLRKPS